MKESIIQNNILKFLRKNGYWATNVTSAGIYANVGTPDILACLPDGKFLAIEVKNEKGKTTPMQEYNLKEIEKLGGFALVARNVEDVKKFLKGG